MTRQEFMNRLASELSRLPKEEIQAAMEYYSEYFDEAGPEREQEALRELGSPSRIAAQIKADYAVRQLDESGGAKKGLTAIWWIVLGVFAAPVALPVAIALGAVAFAVFVSIFAVILALIVSLAAVCISGIGLIGVGIAGMAGSVAGGLLLIGTGLVSAGLTALLCVGAVIGAKALVRFTAKEMQKGRCRRQMRKTEKEGR
ncbi:DUF1700 domain-containing protein [bacterium 210820-DFI.6.37]|nr:DUF1700 domain-containing protein [bacterium 210820-DFI.6.37]